MNEKYIYRKCLYNPKTLHVPDDQNRSKKNHVGSKTFSGKNNKWIRRYKFLKLKKKKIINKLTTLCFECLKCSDYLKFQCSRIFSLLSFLNFQLLKLVSVLADQITYTNQVSTLWIYWTIDYLIGLTFSSSNINQFLSQGRNVGFIFRCSKRFYDKRWI